MITANTGAAVRSRSPSPRCSSRSDSNHSVPGHRIRSARELKLHYAILIGRSDHHVHQHRRAAPPGALNLRHVREREWSLRPGVVLLARNLQSVPRDMHRSVRPRIGHDICLPALRRKGSSRLPGGAWRPCGSGDG